jgi:hypothetical protein
MIAYRGWRLVDDLPLLVVVHECWEDLVHVCGSAYQQQNDEQETLEVEKRRLLFMVSEMSTVKTTAGFIPSCWLLELGLEV